MEAEVVEVVIVLPQLGAAAAAMELVARVDLGAVMQVTAGAEGPIKAEAAEQGQQ